MAVDEKTNVIRAYRDSLISHMKALSREKGGQKALAPLLGYTGSSNISRIESDKQEPRCHRVMRHILRKRKSALAH